MRKNRLRLDVFGSPHTPYPRSYVPQPHSRRFVRHLDNHYSQSHPDEDFAETFAVWLSPGFRSSRDYRRPAVGRKIEAINSIMSGIRGKPAVNQFRGTYEPLHRSRLTLLQYLSNKRKRFGLASSANMDANLLSCFCISKSKGGARAADVLTNNRTQIRNRVADALGEHKYTVDQVIHRLIDRSRKLGLYAEQGIGPIIDIVMVQVLDDLLRKRHHIIL